MPSTSRKKVKSAKKTVTKAQPMEIGWREWVALPEFGVGRIKAKIDTGAKTSAIHAYRIQELEQDGASYAEFYLHPMQNRNKPEIFCIAPIVDKRLIKSSNGVAQERLIVRTTLEMGERSWEIDLSLTNRDDMGFRLLIGRDALRKNIVIRPGRSFLTGKP
jgi:hypothetical protein